MNLLGDHFKLFLQISVSLLKLVELGLQQPSASPSSPCHCHHEEPWNSSIWTPAQVWLGPRESLLFASGSTPAPKTQDIMQNQMSPSPPSKGSPPEKKMFSFGHCPKRGGGDPCPNWLTLFFHHVVPYILTSISCYVILFGHF